ncbi:hypothetical protein ACFL02_08300 [Planctomycetota bacterium]
MVKNQNTLVNEDLDNNNQSARATLCEQLLWLIKLRWIAVASIFIFGLIATSTSFLPILAPLQLLPISICAALLLVSNVIYYQPRKAVQPPAKTPSWSWSRWNLI